MIIVVKISLVFNFNYFFKNIAKLLLLIVENVLKSPNMLGVCISNGTIYNKAVSI